MSNARTLPKMAVTVPEFCECVGISTSKFYLDLQAGLVKAVLAGRKRLVPVREIEIYLSGARAESR